MIKKKFISILLFIGVVFGIYLFTSFQKSKLKTIPKDNQVEQKSIASSEIAKSDKNFYQISTKKNMHKDRSSKQNKKSNATKEHLYSIKKIIDMKYADIAKLDKLMIAFLMDTNISRIEKIDGIWSMLNEIGFSSQKSEYLLDTLATLHPIELTDELMTVYTEQANHNIKMKIIAMLSSNMDIANPEVQDEEKLDFIVEKIEDTQSFLKEKILTKENNKELLSEALHAYADISNAEDIQELLTSLKDEEGNTPLNRIEVSNILTEAAIATIEAQEEILPSLLETMSKEATVNLQQKKAFNEMIMDSLNAGVLATESQKELDNYLKEQEPTLTLKQKSSTDTILKYYTWAKASAKIPNNQMSLETIVLENDNPLKVSSVLLYADDAIIQNIQSNPKTEITYAKLESALDDDKISKENKIIIKDALSRLADDN